MHLAQQFIIFRHDDIFANRKLYRFQPNDQLVALFVYFGLTGVEVILNPGKFLVKFLFCGQTFLGHPFSLGLTFQHGNPLSQGTDFRFLGLRLLNDEIVIRLQRRYGFDNIFDLGLERLVTHIRRGKLGSGLVQHIFDPARNLFGLHGSNFLALFIHLHQPLGVKQRIIGHLLHPGFFVWILCDKGIGVL